MDNEINGNDYLLMLEKIKNEIGLTRNRMMIRVNQELIILYYNIGKYMAENKGYGSKISDRLSSDINATYPTIKGFSPRNLRYMQQFYEVYKDFEIRQQPVAQLP